MSMDAERRARAEEIVGHAFSDPSGLDAALTHPSYAFEHPGTTGYERLEFLGDAVLGFIVSDELYRLLPDAPEGELTRRKHHAVSGDTLAHVAACVGLGDLIRFGRGAEAAGDRLRTSVLENAFEAVIGALYLDAGLSITRDFVVRSLEAQYAAEAVPEPDPKSALQHHSQELLQGLPDYRVVDTAGPPHARTFTAEVTVGGAVVGTGSGRSKQAAEKAAALDALERLRSRGTGRFDAR